VLKVPSPAAVIAKESEPLSAQATCHGIVAPKDLSPNKKAFANSSTGDGSKLMEGRAIAHSKAMNETEEVMGCEKLVRLAIAAGEQPGLSETDLEQNAQQQKDEVFSCFQLSCCQSLFPVLIFLPLIIFFLELNVCPMCCRY
jgi:hypothetical protein